MFVEYALGALPHMSTTLEMSLGRDKGLFDFDFDSLFFLPFLVFFGIIGERGYKTLG